jgi:hypothetical protein
LGYGNILRYYIRLISTACTVPLQYAPKKEYYKEEKHEEVRSSLLTVLFLKHSHYKWLGLLGVRAVAGAAQHMG